MTLRRLLAYARPHWLRLLAGLSVGVVGIAFELLRPFPVKFIVDYVLLDLPITGLAASVTDFLPWTESSNGLIVWAVLLGAAISLGAALTSVLAVRITVSVAFTMVTTLASEVFARLQRLSLRYHRQHALGDLLQRSGSDVFVAQSLVTGVVIPAVAALLMICGMFAIMATIDLVLALVAMCAVPLQAFVLWMFSSSLHRTSEEQWRVQGATLALIENVLGAMKAVQGFSREAFFHRRVVTEADRLGRAYGASAFAGAAYEQAVSFVTGAATAVVLGFGAVRVREGRLTVGDLLVFLGYLAALYVPLRALAQAVGLGVQVGTRARRVFEVLDSTDEIHEPDVPHQLGRAIGRVEFDDVTFGYLDTREPILQEVSFTVEPGEVVALVGVSGAGKTSLVSLLSRFADPWWGRVLLDGVDVRSVSLPELRTNVALVLQEPYLLPISIADNIAFGLTHVDRFEIERAAIAAQADGFIRQLPEGYDTVIGERGATLSGGERQRISIARALLADSPILVLDEPTSALDAHTEQQIFRALDEVIEGRTVFIISHRLSTIRRADRIIAIEHGRVAEVGRHEDLLAAGGVYASLYEQQHLEAR